MSRARIAAVALTASLAACAPPRPIAPRRLDPAALFAAVAPSVVYTRWRHDSADDVTVDTGAGVLIDGTGLVLTTCHQLTDSDDGGRATELEVLLAEPDPERRTFRPSAPIAADVVACSEEPDLGLIRLRGGARGRPAIPLATALPAPGETMVVVGATHLGFLWSVQSCLVSGVGDQRATGTSPYGAASAETAAEIRAGMTPGTVLQAGCHVNPMSGSPALDPTGAIVGLHLFSRYNTDEPPAEVNYYLGVDELRRFVAPYLAPAGSRGAPAVTR